MNSENKKSHYMKWLDPGQMHRASVQWMSELKFTRDEQLFLNDLVKEYTLPLTDSKVFGVSQDIIGAILIAEKEVELLLYKVRAHENKLQVMLDSVDQLQQEKAYIASHWNIQSEINNYLSGYRTVKAKLFKLVSKVMKKDKNKYLLH